MAFIKSDNGARAANPVEERIHARDLPGLLTQLRDADATTRRWAARDLRSFPAASEALVACLRSEQDVAVREVILTTLTQLGDAVAVAGLVECLRSQEAALRNEAIEAMKALPAEVAGVMGTLLTDSDPDVRIMAVNILESLCHPDVEQWLIGVIDRDPEVNVCATAVDLLGEVGTPAGRDALIRLQERFAAEPYIQFAADLALKRIAKV